MGILGFRSGRHSCSPWAKWRLFCGWCGLLEWGLPNGGGKCGIKESSGGKLFRLILLYRLIISWWYCICFSFVLDQLELIKYFSTIPLNFVNSWTEFETLEQLKPSCDFLGTGVANIFLMIIFSIFYSTFSLSFKSSYILVYFYFTKQLSTFYTFFAFGRTSFFSTSDLVGEDIVEIELHLVSLRSWIESVLSGWF